MRLRQLFWIALVALSLASLELFRQGKPIDALILIFAALCLLVVPILENKGHYEAAATVLVGVLTAMVCTFSWISGGLHDLSIVALPGILVFVALLGINKAFFVLLGFILLNFMMIGAAEEHGWIVHTEIDFGYSAAIVLSIIIMAVAGAVWIMASDYRLVLENLTEKMEKVKASQEEVEYLATHDHLTGLPNRRVAKDRFSHAKAFIERHPEQKAAIALLGLDDFKTINDALGHSVGDQLLLEVSRRMLDNVRGYDTVCRMGGDEFLVIMENIKDAKDASIVVSKLLKIISAPADIDGHEIHCSASAGIVVYPTDAEDYESTVKNADTALQRAKDVGKNNLQFFDQSMNEAAAERMQLLSDMREAIIKDQFFLVFQPVIDLRNDKFVGAEALIRWQHPSRGIVPPFQFIPIAERSGLIIEIGDLVVKKACEANREIQKKLATQFHIAINVSPLQMKRESFSRTVIDAISANQLNPSNIELELTESELVDDNHVFKQCMEKLQTFGVSFAIDDFGTGYSNLGYLRSVNARYLKIDRSFVFDMEKNPDNEAIVKAVQNIARDLGMQTIAEGVEEAEHANMLKLLGVDFAQGYYWSKPVELEDLLAILQNQRTLNHAGV